MKSTIDRKIEQTLFHLCLGAGLLVTQIGMLYATCYGSSIGRSAMIVSASVAAALVPWVLYNALCYTDLLLDRFESTPMCPIVDMIMEDE